MTRLKLLHIYYIIILTWDRISCLFFLSKTIEIEVVFYNNFNFDEIELKTACEATKGNNANIRAR